MTATFVREATIQATPSKVWAALTDLAACHQFMPDIKKVELLSEGDFGLGTRWKETRQMKLLGFIPLRASATIEVNGFEKNKRYSTVADDGCNWAQYEFELTRAGKGASKLRLRGSFKGVGKYADKPEVGQKLAKWCEKADGDLLERIKAYVESES